jgi:integrase
MITQKSVASLLPGAIVWDDGKGSFSGFGARRRTGPIVSYVLKYRTAEGRQRWQTIGRHGSPWTPDLARAEARRILGEVTKGSDPARQKQDARKAATVADFCDDYLAAVEGGRLLTRSKLKKPSTIATDRGRVARHIKPLLGSLKVAAVTRADIERFRDAVADGKTAAQVKTVKHGLARVTGGRGTATRTLALVGVIFTYAIKCGLRADNPAHGVEKHAYNARSRRLSVEEYEVLGKTLGAMPKTWPIALAATKFLALTGWRRGEMLALKWSEVDLATRTARL